MNQPLVPLNEFEVIRDTAFYKLSRITEMVACDSHIESALVNLTGYLLEATSLRQLQPFVLILGQLPSGWPYIQSSILPLVVKQLVALSHYKLRHLDKAVDDFKRDDETKASYQYHRSLATTDNTCNTVKVLSSTPVPSGVVSPKNTLFFKDDLQLNCTACDSLGISSNNNLNDYATCNENLSFHEHEQRNNIDKVFEKNSVGNLSETKGEQVSIVPTRTQLSFNEGFDVKSKSCNLSETLQLLSETLFHKLTGSDSTTAQDAATKSPHSVASDWSAEDWASLYERCKFDNAISSTPLTNHSNIHNKKKQSSQFLSHSFEKNIPVVDLRKKNRSLSMKNKSRRSPVKKRFISFSNRNKKNLPLLTTHKNRQHPHSKYNVRDGFLDLDWSSSSDNDNDHQNIPLSISEHEEKIHNNYLTSSLQNTHEKNQIPSSPSLSISATTQVNNEILLPPPPPPHTNNNNSSTPFTSHNLSPSTPRDTIEEKYNNKNVGLKHSASTCTSSLTFYEDTDDNFVIFIDLPSERYKDNVE